MIDDLIELAFEQDAIRTVRATSEGCDEYTLRRADSDSSSVKVWVRPDGKFSRAIGTEGLLSLGQVMTVCGLTYRTSTRSSRQSPDLLRVSTAQAPDFG